MNTILDFVDKHPVFSFLLANSFFWSAIGLLGSVSN